MLHESADSLDDLLRVVFQRLRSAAEVTATRGTFREELGATLRLTNPRARLSRSETRGKPISALAEFLWYLTKENSLQFIEHYLPGYRDESDDGVSVRSAYGERLFAFRGIDQVSNVIEQLRRKRSSRRAVIQLFDATDLTGDWKSIPCTTSLQFLVRDARLHLIGTMRSNDAYLGLPHDVFAFTMLQEIVARAVGVELGEYIHFAGSLHLYAEHYEKADAYIREDWQALVPMPEMPGGDPWPSIAGVLAFEALSRDNCASELPDDMDPYWADLCRLLAAFRCARNGDSAALKNLLKTLVNRGYAVFLQSRIDELEVRMPSARK